MKSVLLKQIREELLEKGIHDRHIIYINFEDYQYRTLTDSDQFYLYIEGLITYDEKFYLMFDEIQNVKDFDLVVNSFRAVHNVSISIMGFNSKRCWIF